MSVDIVFLSTVLHKIMGTNILKRIFFLHKYHILIDAGFFVSSIERKALSRRNLQLNKHCSTVISLETKMWN